MTSFPLISRYLPKLILGDLFGLPLEEVKRTGISLCRTNKPFVYAADLEAELAKGQRNWGIVADGTFYLRSTEGPCPAHTHECLAIGIQEIQPESEIDEARQIIKDLLDTRDISPVAWSKIPSTEQRARAFLARSRK